MDYSKLNTYDDTKLKKLAKEYELDENLERTKLIEAIEIADYKKRLAIESKARAELELETKKQLLEEQKKLGIKPSNKKSPETIAIESSKKAYFLFHNMESPKTERSFIWGDKYHFHLFPEKIHCLPIALIKHLDTDCKMPVFEKRVDPADGLEKSYISGYTQRFVFQKVSDAPGDAEFGIVLDDSVLSKLKEVNYE